MLQTLRISNYAIINNVEIHFSDTLNIITGETGAGKSILLGALSLLLGQRAESKVMFNQKKKCVIEGVFQIANYNLEEYFNSADIDYSTETIIRRELNESGKSRAFINDTPVTLQSLQQLTEKLVQIHSQHETLALSDSRFQMLVIDSLAGTGKLLSQYQKKYQYHKNINVALSEAITNTQRTEKEKDYMQFQYNELENATLQNINQQEFETTLLQLQHAEEIKRTIFFVTQNIDGAEVTVSDLLRECVQRLNSIAGFMQEIVPYMERIESCSIELKDISTDLSVIAERIIVDPLQADALQNTLNSLYHLQKKHNVKTVEELIEIKKSLANALSQIASASENIHALEKIVADTRKDLINEGKKISDLRKKIIPDFEKKVQTLLASTGMQDAKIKVELNYHENDPGFNGADDIQFTFSANRGSALQDIKKVASGGELSRLMLCIKSLIAKNTALPTLIFDEIDSGISGETAVKVGHIIEKLSGNHQVIAITHLPQIAALGNQHLQVYKTTNESTTETHIRQLTHTERITEIARMLSGENYTEAAIANAKSLMHAAK